MKGKGQLTKFGSTAAVILTLTFLIAGFAAISLDPRADSPESLNVAEFSKSSARQLAAFALTYLFMLFGFRTLDAGG